MTNLKEGRISKVLTFVKNFIKFSVCYIIFFFGLWSTFDCNITEQQLTWMTDQSTLYDWSSELVIDFTLIVCLTEKMIDWPHIALQKTALLDKWIRNSVQNQTLAFIHLSGQDSRTMGIKWKSKDQVSTMLRRQCQITTLGANTNKDCIFSHFDFHKGHSTTYIQGRLYLALFYLIVWWGKTEC